MPSFYVLVYLLSKNKHNLLYSLKYIVILDVGFLTFESDYALIEPFAKMYTKHFS